MKGTAMRFTPAARAARHSHATAPLTRRTAMTRALYLVAYDVHDSRRLGRVCRCLKSYRVDGQKSVPEIWLTPAELHAVRASLRQLINPAEDRIQLIALDPRMKPRCLGRANTFSARHFCIT